MEPDLNEVAFQDAVLDTIRENNYKACYIRPIVYRGYETLGVNPFSCPVEASIMVWEWGAYLGKDAIENGVDVQISSWGRGATNRFPALAKTSANYANSQLIKMESVLHGYAEGIALDQFGCLSEGSGQNLFLVRDNIITTPPVANSILPGITRDVVITIATDLGLTVKEESQPREALYIADEAFFTGTAAEITPIRTVDKITIGSGHRGPLTEAIQRRFFDIVYGRESDTHGWLTSVYTDSKRSGPETTVATVR
jgi:branched-chain amino acid aminotransferase